MSQSEHQYKNLEQSSLNYNKLNTIKAAKRDFKCAKRATHELS